MRTMNGILAIMTVGLVVGACAPTTISPNWGTAYRDMRAKQVLNPTAGDRFPIWERGAHGSGASCSSLVSMGAS